MFKFRSKYGGEVIKLARAAKAEQDKTLQKLDQLDKDMS